MNPDKLQSVEFWSRRLTEIADDVQAIHDKTWQIPIPELTYEERIHLRYILDEYKAVTRLLAETLAEPDPEPIPFYKKLFKR